MNIIKTFILITLYSLLYSQDIAFVGNSTTRNQYPAYTKNYLYNYKIMNYAVTGSAVIRSGYEYRYKQEFQEAINRKAKYTVMLLGSCDWWEYIGNEDYWGTEYKYLAKTLNNHSTVILGLIPYRIKEPNSDAVFDHMNSVIRTIANDIGAPIVDFNSVLGHKQNLYFDDGIHPNLAGQESMGMLLAGLIQQIDNNNNINTGDNTPPSTPKNFSAICINDDIQLQWDPNTETDISKYFIFRGLINGGQTTGIKTLNKNFTSFLDTNVIIGTTYYYQIAAGDNVDNRSKKSEQISATAGNLSIDESKYMKSIRLKNNPNPFNPNTTIYYTLPNDSDIKIEIFDIEGHHIKTLIDGYRNKGKGAINWDGCDEKACQVCSGIYFYTIISDYSTVTNKMTLIK